MKNRNIEITLLKLLFALGVVVMHMQLYYHETLRLEGGAYLFVDFFFMIQGYYLYNKLKSDKKEFIEVREYAINRIKRFFPCVCLQSILLLGVLWIFEPEKTVAVFVKRILGAVAESTFVSMLIPEFLCNNGNLWFLSSAIIGGCIVLYLLLVFKEKIMPFLPIISAVIYALIIVNFKTVDCHIDKILGFIYIGNLRAIAGISLGMFCRHIKEKIVKSKRTDVIAHVVFILSFLYTLGITFFFRKTYFDFSVLIALALLIPSADLIGHMVQNSLMSFLDKIIMPIYIFQNLCIVYIRNFTVNPRIILFGGVALDIAISSVWVLTSTASQTRKNREIAQGKVIAYNTLSNLERKD